MIKKMPKVHVDHKKPYVGHKIPSVKIIEEVKNPMPT